MDRPTIILGYDMWRVIGEAMDVLAKQEAVSIEVETLGPRAIFPNRMWLCDREGRRLRLPQVRELLSKIVRWERGQTSYRVLPPRWVAEGVMCKGEWPGVPQFETVRALTATRRKATA